jgi:hypothetical protein
MHIKNVLKLALVSLFFVSCLKQTEKITPLAKPMTLAELQRASMEKTALEAAKGYFTTDSRASLQLTTDPNIFYLNVKYKIKRLDIFEAAGVQNTFEKVGHSLLGGLAKFFLSLSKSKQVNITPIIIDIPDLNLDTAIVKSIRIKSITLQYNAEVDQENDYAGDFSFINSIDFSRPINVPKVGKVDDLYFSYQKSKNNCLYKCLNFDIIKGDITSLVMAKKSVTFKPSLNINSFPKVSDLVLDGSVELQIGLKTPF